MAFVATMMRTWPGRVKLGFGLLVVGILFALAAGAFNYFTTDEGMRAILDKPLGDMVFSDLVLLICLYSVLNLGGRR